MNRLKIDPWDLEKYVLTASEIPCIWILYHVIFSIEYNWKLLKNLKGHFQSLVRIWKCVSSSVVSNSVTPWTVVCQAPLSMGFPRQEYWRGLPFPSPGDLPNPSIEPRSSTLQSILYHLSHQGSPSKSLYTLLCILIFSIFLNIKYLGWLL